MPADFTGIENVGEFFSQHYVDELLLDDLKELRAAWAASPNKPPPDRLRALARDFARTHEEAARAQRPDRLYQLAHPLHLRIADALGYPYSPALLALEEGRGLPVLYQAEKNGEPYLWILEGRFYDPEKEGVFDLELLDAQLDTVEHGLRRPRAFLADLIAESFSLEAPPRWILVLSGTDILLCERARWGRGQYLRFDLAELLGRKDTSALAVLCGLTCKDALVPDQGAPVHDSLDENSHKHAHGVSSELKYAARKAVELLGNEYVHYQRTIGKKGMYGERAAAELTAECLTYLYRLLFLFYAEARAGELGSLPMDAEEYLFGYSLESLRDLELVPLTTPQAQDGYFLHESLTRLFSLVDKGWEKHIRALPGLEAGTEAGSGYLERGFHLKGLHSPLFDPRHTPRLSRIKFRNHVLQEVIRLLSLSREDRRGRSRGRISYAQLGIGQLGSVYEGLLSYTGFFSRERLHEVHKAGTEPSDTDQAFFVPEAQIHRYSEDERRFAVPNGEPGQTGYRIYEPGTFIFRLAGRNRETSASYYTPEVLTRCLVKYSLKELLQDKTADQVLALTVCEPALGSGAFVVEAIDQLADAYLERKQSETGMRLLPDEYGREKQKVKAFIAERNCFGVDLNPMAARLAEVSLWLATMHQGQEAPWFGARLGCGNSLVGARLAVWQASDLQNDEALARAIGRKLRTHAEREDLEEVIEELLAMADKDAPDAVARVRKVFADARQSSSAGDVADNEDDSGDEDSQGPGDPAEPRTELIKQLKKACKEIKQPRYLRVPPTELSLADILAGRHGQDCIYHFLLPDPAMSPFDKDRAVRDLVPEAVATLAAWRRKLADAFGKSDGPRLVAMSRRIDELLRHALEDREDALSLSRGPIQVWGQEADSGSAPARMAIDRRIRAHALARAEGRAYHRLRQVMDLWAAQWAWPLEHASALPSRDSWWKRVEEILGIGSSADNDSGSTAGGIAEQLALDMDGSTGTREATSNVPLADETDDEDNGVSTADPVALAVRRLAPFHWPIEFPEVFATGGFDLVVGNPPWIKLQWNEQGILGDVDPRVVIDGLSAAEVARQRPAILGERASEYLADFEGLEGSKSFLNSAANYPLLEGVQTNLYKCFLEQGWRIGQPQGVIGLFHQPGLFDDPRGDIFREALWSRLRLVGRFQNKLMLFADILDTRMYCFTTTVGKPLEAIGFEAIANVFHPRTIDDSWDHDGHGPVPGMRTDDNAFEVKGHRSRLVKVGVEELALFASLFDGPGKRATRARLPIVHSQEVLSVLTKLARHPRRLRDLGDEVYGTVMFDETGAQRDGTIRRETRYPKNASGWVVSGPHFYVGTPLYKNPREGCRHHQDYDPIDLTAIPADYLPRTNYVPACSQDEYTRRMPHFKGRPVADFYRHAHRMMLAPTSERTLIATVVPRGVAHINGVVTLAFGNQAELVGANALCCSLLADYLVRSKGSGHLQAGQSMALVVPKLGSPLAGPLSARALRLNCLTLAYAEIWDRSWSSLAKALFWTSHDMRLSCWPAEGENWNQSSPVRSPFERRQALVEIDALAALELNITADELCTIYRTEFPVLLDNERHTWYDQNGRIAFTTNRGLSGVGLSRADFERWQAALAAGEPTPADLDPQGLVPPFDRCDREEDMRRAYYFFADRLNIDIPDPERQA